MSIAILHPANRPRTVPGRAGQWPRQAAGALNELNQILRVSGIAPIRSATLPRCTSAQCDEVSPRIGRVLEYVDDHLHEPLTVERLADEARLSKYHFSRVFREEVGETPWAFVRRARVEKAKRLLESGASAAAAAFDAGFFDQSHFTNVLKEVEGKTPKQYREAQRGKQYRDGQQGEPYREAQRRKQYDDAQRRKDFQE